ncbi:MAG: AraC family transcriptional regulator [Eubacteriales bacterium]|nr:AraC family transcriptional regulator [Eubacteriales bacterium]MDD4513348.1 AraC family transcriptional regulator [Eubacteriales bacterium]
MQSAVLSAKAYIEARIKQEISEKSLALHTHLSVAYLRELFHKESGLPIGRYITERRVANAAFDVLYTDKSLTEIAMDYGYLTYDTFTRAFKRITGCKPIEFRALRPKMERRFLGGGMFGVDLMKGRERNMAKRTLENEHSVILYDVPRVKYGAFGGMSPFPISLKACVNYLGEDIDYADAITGCGAALRLTWNTSYWDGGNVDICHTYQEKEPLKVYLQGVTALGRSPKALVSESDGDREKIKAFIMECLHKGVPVIAMGIVGPPEAGLVTGYRDDGETLLGWSVFQEWDKDIETDSCGYYVTGKWWENGVDVLVAMGDKVCGAITAKSVAERAAEVMKPRQDGVFAKGLSAYDAWADGIRDDSCFPDADKDETITTPDGEEHTALEILGWRLMCHSDAVDCIADGRYNAMQYFRRHKDENALYGSIADEFGRVSACAQDMFKVLGGFERDEPKMRALGIKENRGQLVELILKAKEADTRAYEMLLKI